MKNKDMPAMPLPNGADERPYTFMDGEQANKNHATGLTKREHLAGLAMQAMISSEYYSDFCGEEPGTDQGYWLVAVKALKHADAILMELDK